LPAACISARTKASGYSAFSFQIGRFSACWPGTAGPYRRNEKAGHQQWPDKSFAIGVLPKRKNPTGGGYFDQAE